MSLVVNTNIASMNAQRSLMSSAKELQTAMERLSSGKKINSAADDAAGFAIAESMTAQIRGLTMAAKNAADGLSMIAVIENASNDVTDMLQRVRELAVQASNGTNSISDRTNLDLEAEALITEINRVANSVSFNNENVLDGSVARKSIQVGYNDGDQISFALGSVKSADLGIGEFVASVEGIEFSGAGETTWSITIDGHTTDVVFDNSGNGLGMVASEIESAVAGVRVTYVDGGPQFRLVATGAKSLEVKVSVNNNGVVTEQLKSSSGSLWNQRDLGISVDSFVYASGSSATDPKLTEIFGSEVGGVLADLSVGDWVAFDNNPSRYYEVRGLITKPTSLEAGIQVDGAPDLPNNDLVGSSIFVIESKTLEQVDLVNGASDALNIVSGAIDMVSAMKANYGASQNRLQYTISNLLNVVEFTTAARSRIQDADFAVEAARLAKAQVLQQSGTAMLAQANAQPQMILSLIR
jgi:flagellin